MEGLNVMREGAKPMKRDGFTRLFGRVSLALHVEKNTSFRSCLRSLSPDPAINRREYDSQNFSYQIMLGRTDHIMIRFTFR